MDEIKLEILEASWYEHQKCFNEIARYLPLNHPKREEIQKTIKYLSEEINKIKNK